MSIQTKIYKQLNNLGIGQIGGGACKKRDEIDKKIDAKFDDGSFGDAEYDELKKQFSRADKKCKASQERNEKVKGVAIKGGKITGKVIFLIVIILVILYFLYNDGDILNKYTDQANREKFKEIFISIQFTCLVGLFIFLMNRFNIEGYGKLLGGSLLIVGLFYVSKRLKNPILYYGIFAYILGKTVLPVIQKFYKNRSINMFIFYIICIYIVHVLWVILTFTSPTLNQGINLSSDRKCQLPWLYYGVYPPDNYDLLDDINKYMFDLSVWYPPDIVDDPSFTCQPCPSNMTAAETLSGGTRTRCRPCKDNEEWYSINQIYDRRNRGDLRPDEKNIITNDGMTIELDGKVPSFNTFTNDHKEDDKKFDKLGMCLPLVSTTNSILAWGSTSSNTCPNYTQCMRNSPAYIELNWPKNDDIRIYPGQVFEIKNLDTNLTFEVPENILVPSPNDTSCNTVNPAYSDNNKFNNRICDESVVNHDNTSCHLRIPIDRIPRQRTRPGLPENNYVIRHGGNDTLSGPPCDAHNIIASDYIQQSQRGQINKFHINHNPLENNNNMNSRFISESSSGNVASDWRNVVGLVYDTCNNNNGQCYIDNSICETSNKTAIPLVDYPTAGSPNNVKPLLTIPTASETGCRNATLISGCSTHNQVCDAMDVDSKGNLIQTDGRCRAAKWENNRWTISDRDETDNSYQIRCFPRTILDNYRNSVFSHPDTINYQDSFLDPTNIDKFQNMCKRIPRLTYPTIGYNIEPNNPCSSTNIPQSDTMTPEQISTYRESQVNDLSHITANGNTAMVHFEKQWNSWTDFPSLPSQIIYPPNDGLFKATPSPSADYPTQYSSSRCNILGNSINDPCCPPGNCNNGIMTTCPVGCLDKITEFKQHCIQTINNTVNMASVINTNYQTCIDQQS